MADYTRRLQVLLTDEQYDFLHQLAADRRQSVGELVRTAFEETYRPSQSIRELQVLQSLGERTYIEESPQQILEELARRRFAG